MTLDLLEEGHSFGEDLVFGSYHEWPYTIEAISATKVILMTMDVLMQLLQSSAQLTRQFLKVLSDRIYDQNARISILSQRSLREKISSYLLNLYEQQRYMYSEAIKRSKKVKAVIELPVSKEVVARLLAMPRPSFSRELVKMEKDGLIKISGRHIFLLDMDGLEQGVMQAGDEF